MITLKPYLQVSGINFQKNLRQNKTISMINSDTKIAVIGLGYVGLPLAVEFAKKYITKGFDINNDRIIELNNCIDKTLELSKEQLTSVFE
jgi:UDP-N-acetyl-D-galactosamine dehydrogenase